MSPKHEEPTKVYTKRTSTVPSSSFIPVFTSQFSENILPSDEVTPIHVLSDSSFDISDANLLIARRNGKHACTSYFFSSNFVSYSHLISSYSAFISSVNSTHFQVCVRIPFYPRMERFHAGENDDSITE